jgi:hypothetical protein
MTRAEHKRALEDAVRNQAAAMREARGQVFLPKLTRPEAKHSGDIYAQVVAAGQELLQTHNGGSKGDRIASYYSREDVQQAMYQYARGRKISVLRNFRPMFRGSELRRPDDILPIMMFYSHEPGLWPSIHGTISRQNGDGKLVCDLVVETDFKKSRGRSFGLARPLIRLFQDLGVEFRVKFSGNASPHIIIPAEAFPEQWRKSDRCRSLYGKLLDFFRKQIKQPNALDGSFRNPSHFLRMPYSLNEYTGLVSVPIRVEDYDRFSWEMARPEGVVVMADWWDHIPEDASERTETLIKMALGRKTVFGVNSDVIKHQESLAPQMPDVLGVPVQMGMVRTGEEIAARGSALMEEPSMQDALRELYAGAADDDRGAAAGWQLVRIAAQKYGINSRTLQLLWQWSNRADALAYYSRPDVQEAMYLYAQGRCIRLEGTDEYLTLNQPSDVSALAAYMVGGGVVPAFRCTNARYDIESGEMTACDMVIQVDRELSNSVALLLRGFDMPSFVLYSGGAELRIVIPFEVLESGIGLKLPLSRIPDLAEAFNRHLRRMLKAPDGVYVSLYEGSTPIPYSVADDGERANLPAKLEDVSKLSPNMACANAVGTIERIESFMPPDAGEKAAKFFKDVIL